MASLSCTRCARNEHPYAGSCCETQIGKQAVAARLRAGAHFSSSRVHACESSLAGLPGLYSGSFYSARSVRKAMGPLESPKSENPLRKQRAF